MNVLIIFYLLFLSYFVALVPATPDQRTAESFSITKYFSELTFAVCCLARGKVFILVRFYKLHILIIIHVIKSAAFVKLDPPGRNLNH